MSERKSATDRLFSPKTAEKETEMTNKHYYLPKEQTQWVAKFCFQVDEASNIKISQSQVISKLIAYLQSKNINPAEISSLEDLTVFLEEK